MTGPANAAPDTETSDIRDIPVRGEKKRVFENS